MVAIGVQDARLYFDQHMDDVEFGHMAGGDTAVYSARSPDKQTANEDAAAVIPVSDNAGVLVVADGLGGLAAGEQAAHLAVEAVKDALADAANHQLMLRTAILNGFENANRQVQGLGVGAGTTLAVTEIDDRIVRPYHVGDSMILVAGGRGKIKLQTVSHSPVGYAVEAGAIDVRDAMHHEDRHVVSNVIGTHQMRIEVGPTLKLSARDTLLIATDGLMDNLHLSEIVEYVRKGPMPDAIHQLVAGAQQRMNQPSDTQPSKPDDLTIVTFRLGRKTEG